MRFHPSFAEARITTKCRARLHLVRVIAMVGIAVATHLPGDAHADSTLLVAGQSDVRHLQVGGSSLYFLTGVGADPHYISSIPITGGSPTQLVTITSPSHGDQDAQSFVMDGSRFYGWWGGYAPGSLWSAPRSGGTASYYFTANGAAFLGQDDTRLFFYQGFYSPIRTVAKDGSGAGVLGGGCGWPRANAIDANFIYCQDYSSHNYSRTSLTTGVEFSLGVTGSNEFNVLVDFHYLYFLNRNGNNNIEQFDKEGNYVRTIVSGNSTALMSDDVNLYFYDDSAQSISAVSVDGGLPTPLVAIARGNLAHYVAADGVLYYVDTSLGPDDNRILAIPVGEVCGDGVIDTYESCDDGNSSSGDGCSGDCAIEAGWACAGEPSLCDYYCPGSCDLDLAARPKVVKRFVKGLFRDYETCATDGESACPCPTSRSEELAADLSSSCAEMLRCQVNRAYSYVLKPDWDFESQCWVGGDIDCRGSAVSAAQRLATKNLRAVRPGQSKKTSRLSALCATKLNNSCPGAGRAHDVCVAPLRIGNPDGTCASCMDAASSIVRASNSGDSFNDAMDAFLRVTMSSTLSSAPPDVRAALAALALQADSDSSELREFLTVRDLYELLQVVEPDLAALDDVLVRLNEAVDSAYKAPDKRESQLIILMANVAATFQHPGALIADSRLTALGSIIFPDWFANEFPVEVAAMTRVPRAFGTNWGCRAKVTGHYISAMLSLNLRAMPAFFVDAFFAGVTLLDISKLKCASVVPLVTLKACALKTTTKGLAEWIQARGGDAECAVPNDVYQEIGETVVTECLLPSIHPEQKLVQCGLSGLQLYDSFKRIAYQDAVKLFESYWCVLENHTREDANKCESCDRNGGCLRQAIDIDSSFSAFLGGWIDPLDYRVSMQCDSSSAEYADDGDSCTAVGMSAGTCSSGQCIATGTICSPGSQQSCTTGAPGICSPGTKTCNSQGTGYGNCNQNQSTQPETAGNCSNGLDDDCDGDTDSADADCQSCSPGSTRACSTGLPGVCSDGFRTCNSSGTGYGSCQQAQSAGSESCGNGLDDDCDGSVDEGCGGTLTTSVYPSGTNSFFPSGAGSTNPSCAGGCSYSSGSNVSVTANPASGNAPDPSFVFSHWSGDANNPSSATTTVTINGARSVTANFLCSESESNSTSGNATSVPLTKPCYGEIRGKLSSSSDTDWFDEGVTVTTGETIRIDLDVPSGVDYDLELYGPSASCSGQCFLANSDNGSGADESITYTTEASGFFGFRVYLYAGSVSSASYVLTHERD